MRPTAETAGQPFSLTVTAENSSGATDTGYTGTIQFSSSDFLAGLPANFTFTAANAGTYTFDVTLRTASSQSITATDTANSTITGTVSAINVSPAAASQFILTGLPSTTIAGVVTKRDRHGGRSLRQCGDQVTTASSSSPARTLLASLPATTPFTLAGQGVRQFTLTLGTAGTQSVTVTDAASGITASQSGITVLAGAAKTLTITGLPSDDTAGTAGYVTVTAYDAYGNVATAYTGTVSLTSTDPHAILPSSLTFPGTTGKVAFTVTLETAGEQSITGGR